MPESVAAGIGRNFAADDFNQSIQNALQRRDEMRTEFEHQDKARKEKEKNDVYSEYLSAIRPDYKGINPILYNQYHAKYMEYAHKLVDAFKGAESQPEMTASFSDILGEAEGTRNGLVNASKGWNALQEEDPTKLNVEQQSIRKWYDSGAWAKQSDDKNKEYLQAALKEQKGGSISFDPNNFALGMASTPAMNWNKIAEQTGQKLTGDKIEKVNLGYGSEETYSVTSDEQIKKAYEGLINASGTQVQGLALSELMNNPSLYNDKNNWQTDANGNIVKDPKTGTGVPSQSYIDKFNENNIGLIKQYSKRQLIGKATPPYIRPDYAGERKEAETRVEAAPHATINIGGTDFPTYNDKLLGKTNITSVPSSNNVIDPNTGQKVTMDSKVKIEPNRIFISHIKDGKPSTDPKDPIQRWMLFTIPESESENVKQGKKRSNAVHFVEAGGTFLYPIEAKQYQGKDIGYSNESYDKLWGENPSIDLPNKPTDEKVMVTKGGKKFRIPKSQLDEAKKQGYIPL